MICLAENAGDFFIPNMSGSSNILGFFAVVKLWLD